MIAELKRALNSLKDISGERESSSSGDHEITELRGRVKVLTIENIKLGEIVERFGRKSGTASGKDLFNLEGKV